MLPKENNQSFDLCLKNKSELVNYLCKLNPFESNDKVDKETLDCSIYALILMEYFQISSINITKTESPDFKFKYNDITIGVEHTKGTDPFYKAALNGLSKEPEGTVIVMSKFKPSNGLGARTWKNGYVRPGEDLSGEPWYGDEQEDYWAEYISKAISKKMELLNSGNYQVFDKNVLLIEDETPIFRVRWSIARDKLIEKLTLDKFRIKFDEINIRINSKVFYNIIYEETLIDCSIKALQEKVK